MFVSDECSNKCELSFQRHYRGLGTRYPLGVSLDVYFVGDYTDEAIQDWAKRLEVNPDSVRTGAVTLNHDDRYTLFDKPKLPAAFLIRGGQVVDKL